MSDYRYFCAKFDYFGQILAGIKFGERAENIVFFYNVEFFI